MEQELQEEEREVLTSIYEGDESFKQLSPNVYQYKYGENEDVKSFLLELQWGSTYPNNKPIINMDTFYNKHIIANVKKAVKDAVSNEAEQYLGSAMTYTLFEFVKENYTKLIEGQPDTFKAIKEDLEKITITDDQENISKKGPKKEQLTKAQKRRQWDRVDGKGDRPRGWDWVDIVKHLSQTGSKEDSAPIN